MHGFEKMLEKKGKKVSPLEQRAKKDVLSGLSEKASKSMGEKLSGLKKVSVMAPSEEGLKEGLEKAEEIVESGMPEMEMEEPKMELPETMEETDKMIEMLLKHKEMLSSSEPMMEESEDSEY